MFTRFIYPIWLREKISWRVQKFYSHPRDQNITLHFDKKVKLDLSKNDIGHKALIFNGFYELNLSRKLLKLAEDGGLLIDVGANYGYFSCLWASRNPINRVEAFEASPMNTNALQNNVDKNRLGDRIRINKFALGKEKGVLAFDLVRSESQTGWGGLSLEHKTDSVEVEVGTLDSFAQEMNITSIDVLKIDVEGADTWVLYGAARLIKERRINHIFFENNIQRMKLLNIEEGDAKTYLENLGYTVEKKSSTDYYAFP